MTRRPAALVLVVTVALTVAAGACTSEDDDACGAGASCRTTSSLPADASEQEVAAAEVCGVLVDFDDAVAQHVNAASHQIHPDTDPDHARELLLTATQQVREATNQLPDEYAALDLSSEGDIGKLVEDASAVTGAISEQLDAIKADLDGELRDEGPREMLSAVFIKMEKVQSLAQPEIDDYHDDALVDALNAEPACEHTISH